jgi:hypothetical protein
VIETVMAGVVVVVAATGLAAWFAHDMREREAWSAAAEKAGLQDVTVGTFLPRLARAFWATGLLTGRAGAHRVRLETYSRTKLEEGSGIRDCGLRLVVEGASGITLRAETDVGTGERALGDREVEIGDAGFDREVNVHGPEEVLRAVLDADTRVLVRQLLSGNVPLAGSARMHLEARVAVRDGELVVEVPDGRGVVLQSNLPGVVATLLEAAARLARPASIVKRLVENTRTEPEWQVRRENVRLLAASYPRVSATREMLARACEDEREEVQLEAALGLGEAGHPLLLEIAAREWAGDATAARAIETLGHAFPLDRALAALPHALRTRRRQTARACLGALGRVGGDAVVAPLAKVMAVESADLAVPAAQALGACGAAPAEGPLLLALEGGRDEGVRLAAAVALGQVGTAASVLPLKAAADREGGLRKAAREAVAQIQSRLGGASPGQLSLSGGDEGALSLADQDPRGQVSMAKPPPTVG